MVWSNFHFHYDGVLECVVMLFQFVGVFALFLTRLTAGTRLSDYGRALFIVALFGLGASGALCGGTDSEFAMFAGGTMTVLLIGITMGSGQNTSVEEMHDPLSHAADAPLAV